MKNIILRSIVVLSSLAFLSACGGGSDKTVPLNSDIVTGSNFNIDIVPVDDVSDVIETDSPETASEDEGPSFSIETPPPAPEQPPVVIETPPAPEEPPVVVEAPPAPEPEEENFQCVAKNYYNVKLLDGSDNPGTQVLSYDGSLPTKINYNYYSYSGHPILGPTSTEFEGNFFITQGSDGVAFNFVYSVDAGGSPDNQVKMDVIITGNDGVDRVLLSDDSAEVKRTASDDKSSTYEARLHYWSNTDGAAIGPIANQNFKAKVRIFYVGDNKKVGFHSADGKIVPLELAQSTPTLYSEFEVTFSETKKECSKEAEATIARNQCIDEVYQTRKEALEEVDYQEGYQNLIKQRREAVTELRESHDEQIVEIRQSYNEKISNSREVIKESLVERKLALKDVKADRLQTIKEIKYSYSKRIKELTETYKKDRSNLVAELDSNIAEARNYTCKKKKGFFRKLICKIKKFIKKLIKKIIIAIKKFFGKYTGPVSANNAQELKAIKASAMKQMSTEHKKKIKEIKIERDKEIKETVALFKGKIEETLASYKERTEFLRKELRELIAERSRTIKEKQVSFRNERKALADKLHNEAKKLRSGWVKNQDEVHIEFETAARACFPNDVDSDDDNSDDN